MERLEEIPPLQRPVLLIALTGWSDAGSAASGAVRHLADAWSATDVLGLDGEDYYDFQVTRPEIMVRDGSPILSWPGVRIALAAEALPGRDVLLLQGIEPSYHWRTMAEDIVGTCLRLGVTEVHTLGALLAEVPHSRPIPVHSTSRHAPVRARFDVVEEPTYTGPVGMLSVLGHAFYLADVHGTSTWASIPHYAGMSPSPKAIHALVNRLEIILGAELPTAGLAEESLHWELAVADSLAGEDDLAEYVAGLEQGHDANSLAEGSAELLAREFEKYMRDIRGEQE